MDKRLLKSGLALLTTLGIGALATFALFTSNTATISNNLLTSGTANIKLCDATTTTGTNTWSDTIAPNLNLTGVAPGEDKQLTADKEIYLGNDSSDLDDNLGSGKCNTGSNGNSTVNLRMIPKVIYDTGLCSATLADLFKLKFQIGAAGNTTDYKTLAEWAVNTETIPPTFNPDEDRRVRVFATLADEASEQGATCSFNITFHGEQPASESPEPVVPTT
jgi:hypothetical protein